MSDPRATNVPHTKPAEESKALSRNLKVRKTMLAGDNPLQLNKQNNDLKVSAIVFQFFGFPSYF